MQKSKYLNLASLFTQIDNDIMKLKGKNYARDDMTILDLNNFNDLICIDKNGFEGCKNLKTVFLPLKIERILDYAFNKCGITNLNFNNITNLFKIGESAFANNKFKRLDLSNCTKLKTIEDNVFFNNEIIILKLPYSILKIGDFAFEENKIEELDLSNYTNLKLIDENAFIKNPLQKIKILGGINVIYDSYFSNDLWNKFVDFYNINGKKAGDYKLINNQWQIV